MKRQARYLFLMLVIALTLGYRLSAAGWAEPYDVIICGSGGEEEYRVKFVAWGNRLRRILVEDFNHPESNAYLLNEACQEESEAEVLETSLENIRSVFSEIGERISPKDDLFVFLIGHGSFFRGVSKLHIPGPDIAAGDLKNLLEQIPARRIVLVNASSSSAGFVNELSGPGRIICTATRTVDQKDATEFMEFFIQSLQEGSADQDRDERISVLEVCRQAASMTNAWYMSQGLIPTEGAILDDNADGLGSRLFEEVEGLGAQQITISLTDPGSDGELATECFLKDFSFPPSVPRSLVNRYLSLLEDIRRLKKEKASTETDEYYAKLEQLLIDAAKTNREIRRASSSGE